MKIRPGGKQKGDVQQLQIELAELYSEYYDKIARYATAHIGNRSDAEDLAGEVFLKALGSLDNFQYKGVPLQAWLFKIAHNLVVDYLRKMSKRKTVDIESVILKSESSPEEIAERDIELERVRAAMAGLTADQRQVISLRFLGELSSKETARVMGKSDGAVREMQRAALVKLRVLLKA